MADSQKEKIHYVVWIEGMLNSPEHIFAINQEDAARQVIDAYVYGVEDYDGEDVFVVPASAVGHWSISLNSAYDLTKVKA